MTPFLVGERVYLRVLENNDANTCVRWFNDAEVCFGNSHHVYPFTKQDAVDYITNTNDLALAIIAKKNSHHIGNVALQNIHPIYRSADFSIIIGEKDYWGRGYGREAAALMFNHGFSAMNLCRIACATFSTNPAMWKLAESLGMKEEGIRRKAAFKDGSWLHVIEFGLIKEDFR